MQPEHFAGSPRVFSACINGFFLIYTKPAPDIPLQGQPDPPVPVFAVQPFKADVTESEFCHPGACC